MTKLCISNKSKSTMHWCTIVFRLLPFTCKILHPLVNCTYLIPKSQLQIFTNQILSSFWHLSVGELLKIPIVFLLVAKDMFFLSEWKKRNQICFSWKLYFKIYIFYEKIWVAKVDAPPIHATYPFDWPYTTLSM